MLTQITTYCENGRTFLILKDEHGYWGIEDKHFKDGKLTRQLNGITGHLTTSVADTITLVSQCIKVDALVASGMDRLEAVTRVYEHA